MPTSNPAKTCGDMKEERNDNDVDLDSWTTIEASETLRRWFLEEWNGPESLPKFPTLAATKMTKVDKDSAYESMLDENVSTRSLQSSHRSITRYSEQPMSPLEGDDTSLASSVLDLNRTQDPMNGRTNTMDNHLKSMFSQGEISNTFSQDAPVQDIPSAKYLAPDMPVLRKHFEEGMLEPGSLADMNDHLNMVELEALFQPSVCLLAGCRKAEVFESFQSYRSHIKNVHSNAIFCSFPGCSHNRPFANHKDLKRHTFSKHNESDRPFRCTWLNCPARVKAFKRKDKLREHDWKYHHNYPCFLCSEHFESFEACAEHVSSKHLNHKLYQDVQRSEENRGQNQGLAPTQSPGYADHRNLAKYMPKPPALNHSIVKISPISKEVAALGEGDIEPAKTEDLNVVNAICLPSRLSYTPPVNMASPNEPAKVSFETTPRAASDTACGSRNTLDTIEEAPENSKRQHQLLSGLGLPPTSSTEKDRGQEISRCLEPNANSSESGSTDMEDQELDSRGGFLGFDSIAECQDGKLDRMRQDLLQSVLDPRRQALVVKIMDEFWQIWDNDWSPGITQCATQSPSSTGDVGAPQPIVCSFAAGIARQQKRSRQDSNERDENDGNDDDFPRRLTKRTLLSGRLSSGKKFACPFRKYNPAKYSINDYYTCALTGQDTISRLKSHLYRVHSTPPYCRRCWKTFDNEGQLESHATAPKETICDSTLGQAPEGVTPQQAEKLRSRAHPYASQSEHDRWESIYKVLFPHIEADNIPSPYFEEPREQVPQTPTSQALQQYESYVHSTVPVRFQSLVEAAVRDVMEPIEATFLRDLDIFGLIKSCLEEASREYREKHRNEDSSQPPVTAEEQPEVCQPYLETSTTTAAAEPASQPIASINFLDEVMQPPPLQLVDYGLDSTAIDRIWGNGTQTDIRNTSDSAYGSGPSCFCVGPCICWNSGRDTQPQGWQIASPQQENHGDAGEQMMGGQTVDLDGVEEIDWNSYLESQALFGLPGQSQLPSFVHYTAAGPHEPIS